MTFDFPMEEVTPLSSEQNNPTPAVAQNQGDQTIVQSQDTTQTDQSSLQE